MIRYIPVTVHENDIYCGKCGLRNYYSTGNWCVAFRAHLTLAEPPLKWDSPVLRCQECLKEAKKLNHEAIYN